MSQENRPDPTGLSSPRAGATLAGVTALALWGTNIACARSLIEKLGPINAGAWVHTLGGAVAALWWFSSARERDRIRRLPRAYLWGCGALFVIYMPCLYLALGLSQSRQQAVEVAIVNYLWPSLTLVLSAPLLGKRARWPLAPGIVLAFTGVALVIAGGIAYSWAELGENLRTSATPYLLAFVCAVAWALYSNLSRRWAASADGGAVSLFILCTGLVFLAMRPFAGEDPQWSARAAGELAYMAALPTLTAYMLWEFAMRRGNLVLVASLSYGIPLLSMAIMRVYLNVRLGPAVWLACAMVIAGAVICRKSIED